MSEKPWTGKKHTLHLALANLLETFRQANNTARATDGTIRRCVELLVVEMYPEKTEVNIQERPS